MANVIEIPEDDLKEFSFNHKSVRAYISSARAIERKDPEKDYYGKTDIVVDFVIRGDQPDHDDLAGQEGTKVTNWFRPYGPGVRMYKDFCRAVGLDRNKPDLDTLENMPVIIAVKTNGDYVNVNKVVSEVTR